MLHRRCQRRGRSQRAAMELEALRRGCLFAAVNASRSLRRAKDVGAIRFECPLVAVNGSRWARETRDRGPFRFLIVMLSEAKHQLRRRDADAMGIARGEAYCGALVDASLRSACSESHS